MPVHPTAIIHETATLASNVEVGAYAIIEPHVSIGAGARIAAHTIIRKGSVLAEGVQVDSFAVVGGLPQDTSFNDTCNSGVKIGARTVLREHVTVNRSTREGGVTLVGADCFLMAGAHIGHDCVVGEHVIIANDVLLAGHVSIGDWCFLGGSSVYHQFLRVGAYAMVSGGGRMSHDVPPFVTAAERNGAYGLNLIGLKRRGFSKEEISDIKRAYRTVYLSDNGSPVRAAQAALDTDSSTTARGHEFLSFVASATARSVIRSRKQDKEGGK